ncbi:hypothetical protein [Flagellimonas pelagia]|uniref:Uncharacterized protein n=1 Tax=Flagellimonas pelagia TaxID=2306998 RepID=A0ABY3KFH7_9FLAO|nr:hypothetical protein [Allomuricauda maritima]TXJ92478.1 hypothetical protein FQ017_13685 [Allomuricauda maritima]
MRATQALTILCFIVTSFLGSQLARAHDCVAIRHFFSRVGIPLDNNLLGAGDFLSLWNKKVKVTPELMNEFNN